MSVHPKQGNAKYSLIIPSIIMIIITTIPNHVVSVGSSLQGSQRLKDPIMCIRKLSNRFSFFPSTRICLQSRPAR